MTCNKKPQKTSTTCENNENSEKLSQIKKLAVKNFEYLQHLAKSRNSAKSNTKYNSLHDSEKPGKIRKSGKVPQVRVAGKNQRKRNACKSTATSKKWLLKIGKQENYQDNT